MRSGKPEVMHVADIDRIVNWDLHPDGKRFVISVPPVSAAPAAAGAAEGAEPRFVITLNWVSMLERLLAEQRP